MNYSNFKQIATDWMKVRYRNGGPRPKPQWIICETQTVDFVTKQLIDDYPEAYVKNGESIYWDGYQKNEVAILYGVDKSTLQNNAELLDAYIYWTDLNYNQKGYTRIGTV